MATILVCKKFSFSAAHFLPNYNGPCKDIHGHNWTLEVGITGPINVDGFVMDFKDIKDMVNKRVVEYVDHKFLNEAKDSFSFPSNNPTAEKMLIWMADKIIKGLYHTGCMLVFLRLHETENSFAEWRAYNENC